MKVVEKLRYPQAFPSRRLKGDVEANLPRKKIILYAHMVRPSAVPQRAGEQDHRRHASEDERRDAPIGATALNNMLMQLRKNCNHPDLISGGWTDAHVSQPDRAGGAVRQFRLLERLMTKPGRKDTRC